MDSQKLEPWHILHIDDNADDHFIVRTMLGEAKGRTILLDWAASFEEGRQKLYADGYQAVLVDYDLGSHTGIDLIREFVDQGCGAAMILLTGRGSDEIDLEAMRAGAMLYLNKNEVSTPLLERLIRYAIERKQVEDELKQKSRGLRESEHAVQELAGRFQAVLENSLDVAYRRNLQTDRYDYMSPVIEQVLGLTIGEMMGMPIEEALERIHPLDREGVVAGMLRSQELGKGKLEYRFRGKAGRYRWLADHVTVTLDDEGRPLYRTGIVRDVTEQMRAEQALRISEERFQLASRAMNGVLYDWSVDRKEMYQSEGLERVVGYHPGEEPGGSKDWWPRNIHPEDSPGVQEQLQAAIEGKTDSFAYEYRIRHKDGHWVHIWDQGHIVRDETGQARRVVGMCTDISDRVRTEQALRESEERYRQLAEAMPQLVWTARADGTIDYYNQRVHFYRGLETMEETCQGWRVVLHPEDLPSSMAIWEEAVRTGTACEIEHRMQMADGSYRWHLMRGTPAFDERGQVVKWYGTSTDIQDQKCTQAALGDYADKLKRSNEELQNFAFVASHDLQEPLRKIRMFGNSLRHQLSDRQLEEAEDSLNRMQNAAERMQAMIQGLLQLSRINTRGGRFEPVNLTQVAEEVVSDLEAQIHATRGQVIIEPLPVIAGDPLQLRQLLQNLVGNALKFHKEGVAPVVRVHGELNPAGKPALVTIMVEDNGIGFDESYADRLFQPFVRLQGRGQFEGSGMGLAICNRIVDRHGGKITANSRPGEGSRFTVTLPAVMG